MASSLLEQVTTALSGVPDWSINQNCSPGLIEECVCVRVCTCARLYVCLSDRLMIYKFSICDQLKTALHVSPGCVLSLLLCQVWALSVNRVTGEGVCLGEILFTTLCSAAQFTPRTRLSLGWFSTPLSPALALSPIIIKFTLIWTDWTIGIHNATSSQWS